MTGEPLDASTVKLLMDAQASIHAGAEAVFRGELFRLEKAWRVQQNLLRERSKKADKVRDAIIDLRQSIASHDGSRADVLSRLDGILHDLSDA